MDDAELHISKCEYSLRVPHESLTDADLERITAAAAEWGRSEDVVCETKKTTNGFEITLHVPEDDHEAYCTSLYFHLAGDTFLDLEKKGLWMTHVDD